MFDLRTKLLDLDEDLERLTWGVQAARAVSAAISLDHGPFRRPFPWTTPMERDCTRSATICMKCRKKCAETWTCAWRR